MIRKISGWPIFESPEPPIPPSPINKLDMVTLPGGCFLMGSPETERQRNKDEALRERCVEAFAIGRNEITFEEFDLFSQQTNREPRGDEGWGRENRPAIGVSGPDAIAYTEWLSEVTGRSFRLPTETEWEYAARAGSSTPFWWGEEPGISNANCSDCGSRWDNKQTSPVGSFGPNAWGLYDTSGNVWEWVHGDSEQRALVGTVQSTEEDGLMLKGGSWSTSSSALRSANRGEVNTPDLRDLSVGFRVVEEIQ